MAVGRAKLWRAASGPKKKKKQILATTEIRRMQKSGRKDFIKKKSRLFICTGGKRRLVFKKLNA